jgi:hypothetical protein
MRAVARRHRLTSTESAPNPWMPADEGSQQSTVLDLMSRARAKGISYALNWMFWDRTPGSDPVGTAWG